MYTKVPTPQRSSNYSRYLGTSIEGESPGFVILMVLPKVCLDSTHYRYYPLVYEMINEYTRYYEPAIRWGRSCFVNVLLWLCTALLLSRRL